MLFQSDRRFKMWDYNVSHNQLLLRSPRTPEVPDNIDIIFWHVRFLGIPTKLGGIVLDNASAMELTLIETALGGKCDALTSFCIRSENKQYFIVAGGLKVLRNRLDIFDSSLVYFNESDTVRAAGDVLAHS